MVPNTTLLSIIDQIPGCWGCKDTNSVFVYANKAFGNLIGLDNHLDCIGKSDFDISSPSTLCATDFRRQDVYVMETKQTLKILDIHPYPDGKWRAHIFTKTPWFNENNEIVGVIFHGQELEDTAILEVGHWICRATGQSLKRDLYSSTLCSTPKKINQRESQVLFFLLYGKKPQFIANAMNISVKTVEGHVARLRNKFGASTKNELIELALDEGFGSVIPESLLKHQISVVLSHNI
ncbi:helix-turn-helix transcriptional regulator [Vibrio sp. SCSIO 43132]|nr:helix-turn-helix transcriptional regulator [Vibrio sp. SCSIO 43132]